MTKKAEKLLTIEQESFVASVVQSLDSLSTARMQWEATHYKKATDSLYSLLADCLGLYQANFLKGDEEARKAIRKGLIGKLSAEGIKTQANSTTLSLMVRYVFKSDRKRAHSYAYVLAAALSAEPKVSSENFVQWVTDAGGLEEIKRQLKESDKAKERRIKMDNAQKAIDESIIANREKPLAKVEITNFPATKRSVLITEAGANGEHKVICVVSDIGETLFKNLIKCAAVGYVADRTEAEKVNREAEKFIPAFANNETRKLAA